MGPIWVPKALPTGKDSPKKTPANLGVLDSCPTWFEGMALSLAYGRGPSLGTPFSWCLKGNQTRLATQEKDPQQGLAVKPRDLSVKTISAQPESAVWVGEGNSGGPKSHVERTSLNPQANQSKPVGHVTQIEANETGGQLSRTPGPSAPELLGIHRQQPLRPRHDAFSTPSSVPESFHI